MKIPPARADRFCAAPDPGIRLVLIYGPNDLLFGIFFAWVFLKTRPS